MSNFRWYPNTDTVDIKARSIGLTTFDIPDRGLSVQIRHNGDKGLLKVATEMQAVIQKALNEHFAKEGIAK